MASKEWRDANLEHCRAVERARYAKNRARYRAYRDKWRAANAELVSERAKEYRLKNRGRLLAKARDYYKNNRDKFRISRRASELRRLYGISHADYMGMMKAQRGRCAICGDKSKRTLHVDHAHAVYPVKVRALLCFKCNAGLAVFMEDTARLSAAIKYLKKHGAVPLGRKYGR